MQGESDSAQRDYANAWIAALAPFGTHAADLDLPDDARTAWQP
jgi:hypothetical protein